MKTDLLAHHLRTAQTSSEGADTGLRGMLNRNQAYQKQWHLHGRTHGVAANASLNCPNAWDALGSFGSGEVVVGIVDDGFNLKDPAFRSYRKFAGGARVEDDDELTVYSGGDALPLERLTAGHPHHGDAQCGLIGADISETLPVGVAPNARLFPIRLEKEMGRVSLSERVLDQILDVAASHCDILLNSWGKSPDLLLSEKIVNRIADLSDEGGRRNKGVLFVWPSGNGNRPINHVGQRPIIYSGGVKLRLRRQGVLKEQPTRSSAIFRNNITALPNALVVGAITSLGRRAHYSCYGRGLHLCAPSNNHHALGLRELDGLGVTTCTGWGTSYTDDYKGTSASSAMVAGCAALGISAQSEISAKELSAALIRTASKDLDPSGYPDETFIAKDVDHSFDLSPVSPFETGAFDKSGWSPWFGFGKCDAAALVSELAHPGADG